MADLGARRARRWWQVGRPIRSIGRAGAFVDDVASRCCSRPLVALPSLYEAAGQQLLPLSETVWGPDAQPVWGLEGRAAPQGAGLVRSAPARWAGVVSGFRAAGPLLSAGGAPDDFRRVPLAEAARRVAETLLASGPLPAAVLRQAVGLEGRRGGARFSAAVVELGRALVCSSFGTEQVGAGWPSAVLELTARAFDLGGGEADEVAWRLRSGAVSLPPI
jgi:hypothetical protein